MEKVGTVERKVPSAGLSLLSRVSCPSQAAAVPELSGNITTLTSKNSATGEPLI